MTKHILVDWLVQNETLAKELYENTWSLCYKENFFIEDAREATIIETQRLLLDEMCKSLGLTIGSINVIITEEEFENYIKAVTNG